MNDVIINITLELTVRGKNEATVLQIWTLATHLIICIVRL
jgi:hypothetical protein